MKKRVIALLLIFALLLVVATGCGGGKAVDDAVDAGSDAVSDAVSDAGSEKTDADKPVEKRTDLKLTVYANVLEDYMEVALERFSAETGVKAEGVRLGVGETLGRVRNEKNNQLASVWFGGSADSHIAAMEDGLLEPYDSPNAADIPEKYRDPAHHYTGFYTGYLGFASNKTMLEERGLPVPTSWDEILAPEYKGLVSLANPASSGTSYTLLSTLVQSLGEEAAMEYMVALDKNVKQYEKSGTAPARLVGQSEAMVGITFLHDALKYQEEGFDIEVSTPAEGTGYELGCVSIIKGGPDQEAAKMFVDWLLKPENLEIGQEVGSYQFLTNPNAKNPTIADGIKDAKLIDYDFKFAGENRDRLVEEWSKRTNQ